MGKITIYRFSLYDIRSDALVTSKRWGTRDAIARIGGQIVETSALEAEDTSVLSDVVGLTDVGFTPPIKAIIQSVLESPVAADVFS